MDRKYLPSRTKAVSQATGVSGFEWRIDICLKNQCKFSLIFLNIAHDISRLQPEL